MDKKEIIQRLKKIESVASDYEAAHGLEDDLMYDFIRYVADSGTELSPLARMVLRSRDIDFDRHCA